jgi:hypothetical protein
LVDFSLDHLNPTWHNGRIGSDSISKRLDRFRLYENFITFMDRICNWVNIPFLSDHALIILQLDPSIDKLALPFKLNMGWLTKPDFSSIIFFVSKDPLSMIEAYIQHRIVWKLKVLKGQIKSWAISFIEKNTHRLAAMDSEIQALKDLEAERNCLLLQDKNTYRYQCR